MQPQKPKKTKEISILDRLRAKHVVELGMELQGFFSRFSLEGTQDKKILVALDGDEFLGSALTINGALKIIAKYERKNLSAYNQEDIVTTYVLEPEEPETKIREEAMPRRFPKAKGYEMYGRRFYIVKKKPDGKSSGKIFCLYNWNTRNLLFAHYDKQILEGWLMTRYQEIKDKDI